jgi:hypothetical protein
VPRENRGNTEAQPSSLEDLVRELDNHLSRGLSQSRVAETRSIITGEPAFDDILTILLRGQENGGASILTFMVLNQHRDKAVILLAEVLLKHIAMVATVPFQDDLPSNIDWPEELFMKDSSVSVELERNVHVSRRPLGTSMQSVGADSRESNTRRAMEFIWSTLADLVLASSKRPVSEAKPIINTVHQILALIHKVGLVPATIYAHRLPQETSFAKQPPFLHLLNSKILSTLSDAVWHAYQDEVSARCKHGEKSPWNFFPEPPGSPLRSKGRDLGPEVWVEFILWACIEGGFVSTAIRILKALREDVDNPWRAVSWPDAGEHTIDWNPKRYQEDYSVTKLHRDRGGLPQENEHKIISAEVVIAVADCLITNLDSDADFDKSTLQILHDLEDTLSLLAPRGFPPAYLDYLTVRVLQTDHLYGLHTANTLRQWTSMLTRLRDLQSESQPQREPSLAFEFVLERSELEAGVRHQSLQICIEDNLAKRTVQAFTDIQKIVDGNKLQTIGEFLSLSPPPQNGFFTSRLGVVQSEFLASFGQPPAYRLVPLLDFVSSAKLFGLGDWLLFSDDIDGPVLAPSIWGQPSVSAALARYATARRDLGLLDEVLSKCVASPRKMTVNAMRAFVAGYASFHDWGKAARLLQELKKADGGGYSPKIVASLGATILRLEADAEDLSQQDLEFHLARAKLLFSAVLDGSFDSSPASFRIDQKKTFRLQVGYLLRLLENIGHSELAPMASHFKTIFPMSNEPFLSRDTFNILFAAVVETKGAMEGRRIWPLFCTDPRDHADMTAGQDSDNDEMMLEEHVPEFDEAEFARSQAHQGFNRIDEAFSDSDQGSSDHGIPDPHTALARAPDVSAEGQSLEGSEPSLDYPPSHYASV